MTNPQTNSEATAEARRSLGASLMSYPTPLVIALAVLLCLISSGLMLVLPSKSLDVESVYGAF